MSIWKNLEKKSNDKTIRRWKIQNRQTSHFHHSSKVYMAIQCMFYYVFQHSTTTTTRSGTFSFSPAKSLSQSTSSFTISASHRIHKLTYQRWAWRRRFSLPNYTGKTTGNRRKQLLGQKKKYLKKFKTKISEKNVKHSWYRKVDRITLETTLVYEMSN